MAEEWRPVRGYTGIYEVSSEGRIRSVEREVSGRERSARRLRGQELTPRIRPDGTRAVNLWHGNKYRQIPVRRIVLEAFDRERPRGFDAKNIDGDPANNRLENLQWAPDRRLRHVYGLAQWPS